MTYDPVGTSRHKSRHTAMSWLTLIFDLDLHSARVHGPCGHTGPHSHAILLRWGLLPPFLSRWVPFLTTPLQFVRGQPGPLLKYGTSQYTACCGTILCGLHIIITKPVQSSFVERVLFSKLYCLIITSVSSYFQETPNMLLWLTTTYNLISTFPH